MKNRRLNWLILAILNGAICLFLETFGGNNQISKLYYFISMWFSIVLWRLDSKGENK